MDCGRRHTQAAKDLWASVQAAHPPGETLRGMLFTGLLVSSCTLHDRLSVRVCVCVKHCWWFKGVSNVSKLPDEFYLYTATLQLWEMPSCIMGDVDTQENVKVTEKKPLFLQDDSVGITLIYTEQTQTITTVASVIISKVRSTMIRQRLKSIEQTRPVYPAYTCANARTL